MRATMRALGLAVVFGTNVASAGVPLVVGVGGETVGEDQNGTLTLESGGAASGGFDSGPNHGYEASVHASAGLRAGSQTDAALGFESAADLGYLFADRFVKLSGVYANAALGNRPGLAARRDVAREAYATAGIGFRLTLLFFEGRSSRSTWLRFGFGGGYTYQGGTRATATAELEGYMRCHARADGSSRCLHVLDIAMVGNTGSAEVLVTNADLVRIDGLGTRNVQLMLGLRNVANTGSISVHDSDEPRTPENTVMTEDLPVISELAPMASIARISGPARFELRGERTGYASLDGDMTIEDRASLTTSYTIRRHTVSLGGFAARTRWWTAKDDPGSVAKTGGGEVGYATHYRGFDVKATAGLARSFYPVLDGSTADSPAIGFRSSVNVSRRLDL